MSNYPVNNDKQLYQLYATLPPATELDGVYEAELTGPNILKPFKRWFLRLTGLPGWRGKHFFGDYALNMIDKGRGIVSGPKMLIASDTQRIDAQEGLVATYAANAPWMWRRCRDEFRQLGDRSVLGVSYFDIPGFRNTPIMFLLHRSEGHPGVGASSF
ncbi:hypothetical protein HBA55_03120 [Pseudomaricurvus alkylphenolicus]|jgi:hypothetical protein|uniref:hypothetical protein n=1 Tax=Pseudomaricurvus alkylphenolicus TaxID=1306991 RepID=UPI001422B3E6|nr:hypothetical protein [Pseudomaricurvus alkylphenolicus]NIB38558.1 hypothetical protein [Pseudomaricurvus alkylphenolicus]